MGFLKDLFTPPTVQTEPQIPLISTGLTQQAIQNIMAGVFLQIPTKRIILKSGETCLFCDHAISVISKLKVVGHQRNDDGFSIRIVKGLTYRTRRGGNQTIRDYVPEYRIGKFYITNRRIIFSAETNAFGRSIKELISYRTENNELILQFTNKSYRIVLPIAACVEKVLEYLT